MRKTGRRREKCGPVMRSAYPARACLWGREKCLSRCNSAVVLLAIDLPADAVLTRVDVPTFLCSEPASVCCAVRYDAAVDVLLAVFSAGCFSGRHLTAANALRDSVLL